jgi:hypothetical protein
MSNGAGEASIFFFANREGGEEPMPTEVVVHWSLLDGGKSESRLKELKKRRVGNKNKNSGNITLLGKRKEDNCLTCTSITAGNITRFLCSNDVAVDFVLRQLVRQAEADFSDRNLPNLLTRINFSSQSKHRICYGHTHDGAPKANQQSSVSEVSSIASSDRRRWLW